MKQAEEYLSKDDDLELALSVSMLKMGNTLLLLNNKKDLARTNLKLNINIPINLGVTQPCETPL